MFYFWLRFGMFIILWTYMIVNYSNNFGISILCFAIAMVFFFFLSLRQVPTIIYIFLSLTIVFHGVYFVEENWFTIILLLFSSIISSLRLHSNWLKVYVLFNLLLSIFISMLQNNHVIELTIMAVFFYFLIMAMHQNYASFKEQQSLYDQLRGEYRKLKRINLLAEQDARLEERNRIARDIHDSVGHRLTALIMKLEMLAIQTKNDGYRELKEMAEESLGETRQAVKALQAEESEGIATVVNLIRKLEAESHIVVQFTMKQGVLSVPLSNQNSVVLYRVIQEALTNAMRHAYSREVHVVLSKSAIGDVAFEISNAIYDRKSFKFGFGLSNMKKRLEEISGRLEVYQTEKKFFVTGIVPAQ
jgi:signal transduction histidine kinase